jgi:hypothetical protein
MKSRPWLGWVWAWGKLNMDTLVVFLGWSKKMLSNKTIDSQPEAPYNAFNMGFCP